MSGCTAKTIKKIISKKINDWLETIDEPVRKQVQNKIIVTGGCITSLLLGEPPNDYDVYLKDHDSALVLAKYYVSKFNNNNFEVTDENGRIKIMIPSDGIAVAEGEVVREDDQISEAYETLEDNAQATQDSNKYRPVFLSTNAITLSDKIQIVVRFYGDLEKIHKNFDYVHTTNGYDTGTKEITLRADALAATLAKELVYVGSLYPLCSVARLRKFIARGWKINMGQILKMCMQISALDLTDIDVLEDQCTGVDSAYFNMVIRMLKDKDPCKVNTSYLVEIINRMF